MCDELRSHISFNTMVYHSPQNFVLSPSIPAQSGCFDFGDFEVPRPVERPLNAPPPAVSEELPPSPFLIRLLFPSGITKSLVVLESTTLREVLNAFNVQNSNIAPCIVESSGKVLIDLNATMVYCGVKPFNTIVLPAGTEIDA